MLTMAEDNMAKTLESLRSAAEAGHAESMFLLGVAYAQGKGIERNDSAAARWFHQAARRAHPRARTSIGYLYSIGRGVPKDEVLAYIFMAQAVRDGDKLAQDMLARHRSQMTAAQIREAERRLHTRRL